MFASKGVKWRSSVSFATFVVGLGIACDLLVYSIIIPVLPFRLEHLGYKKPSALTGWLIFIYSAGLVASTIPIAMFSERYSMRRIPMLGGLVALLGAQIMLMEAPNYWVMCLARVLQGISSSVVWVVGLAMLCDTVPQKHVGRQLGVAIMGLSVGLVTGPPVGGILYGKFGFRAPFIFSISITMVDLLARLLFIERKDALKYGIDPSALPEDDIERMATSIPADVREPHPQDPMVERQKSNTPAATAEKPGPGSSFPTHLGSTDPHVNSRPSLESHTVTGGPDPTVPPRPRSLLSVMGILLRSPRALASMFITFVYGTAYTAQEPTLPLRLQAVWGLDSTQVGLVFLAAVVPTLFASPLTGWITDHSGPEWVTFICLLFSLPWWALVVIRSHFGVFVTAFALLCFFSSGVVSPVTAELAAVSRGIEGVGYAHVYAAFNIAYGIGTAAGPLLGGQIYSHAPHGWVVLCLTSAGILVVSLAISFFYIGEDPLFARLVREHKTHRSKVRTHTPSSSVSDPGSPPDSPTHP